MVHPRQQPLKGCRLWEDASPLLPDGNRGTFTIITRGRSGVSADIDDRMPVWLTPGQFDDWLRVGTDEAMVILLASEPPAMEAYRASSAVSTPRNNTEELLQAVA